MSTHLSFVDDSEESYCGGWTLVTYGRKKPRRQRSAEEVREVEEREAADNQDWTRVVLKSSGPRRTGPVEKRGGADSEARRLAKLEQATTAGKRKVLSVETRRQIANYRMGVGWSQDELNRQCQFPVNTIREIESGHLVPNPRQLNQLNSTIKMNLAYTWEVPVKKAEY